MKQILCFGDSNTYGLVPGTKDRYGWGVRWTSILNDRVEKYGYRVVEEGLCGRTTVFDDPFRTGRRGSQFLTSILETHNPIDHIILMLGTNDCKSVYKATPGVIGRGIELLLEQIKAYAPQAEVLLISPIFLGEKVWQDGYDKEFSEASVQVSKQLGNVYAKIAEKYGAKFMCASDYAQSSSVDEEHLDEQGHRALADAIYNTFSAVI